MKIIQCVDYFSPIWGPREKGKYWSTDYTKIVIKRENSYQKNEEVSNWKALLCVHVNLISSNWERPLCVSKGISQVSVCSSGLFIKIKGKPGKV